MWENVDKANYCDLKQKNLGQICNDEFSDDIKNYASNLNYKTFLEIGTWNGLGSTLAFSNGFKSRTDDYLFYSLECNKDKCSDAAELYKDNDTIEANAMTGIGFSTHHFSNAAMTGIEDNRLEDMVKGIRFRSFDIPGMINPKKDLISSPL